MPCVSDYMEPNTKEKSLSKVAALLDELATGHLDSRHYKGMHPDVYGKNPDANVMVRRLCEALTKRGGAEGLSLEMQIWWRDHQAEDVKREREKMTNSDFVFKVENAKIIVFERGTVVASFPLTRLGVSHFKHWWDGIMPKWGKGILCFQNNNLYREFPAELFK